MPSVVHMTCSVFGHISIRQFSLYRFNLTWWNFCKIVSFQDWNKSGTDNEILKQITKKTKKEKKIIKYETNKRKEKKERINK